MKLKTDNDNILKTEDKKIWVPSHDLALRIMVVSHSGSAGHRGVDATTITIKSSFWWPKLTQDVQRFVKDCLHCELNKGAVIPRPWGTALHADAPNKLLHYDFLFMDRIKTKDPDGYCYVLVIQDDFSSYRELIPTKTADSHVVVTALLSWFSRFGVAYQSVSDQGAHFKNEIMKKLNETMKTNHHFTTAYVPWANGTVERVNRDLLFVVRALLSEFRLQPAEWTAILPLVQMSLNHTPARRLGGLAPITVFAGLPACNPVSAVYSNRQKAIVEFPLEADKIKSLTDDVL